MMTRQYHTKLLATDVARYVLLPGDPGRVPFIAARLGGASEVGRNREFVTHTGTLDGVRVSATSTGIGAPSAAIAVEELIALGADTFIRLGTAGAIADDLHVGDLCVAQAAVRQDGTSSAYMPTAYPAIAAHDVTGALMQAAHSQGRRFRAGIVESTDSFQADVYPETMPQAPDSIEMWRRAKVLCIEMETSALFVVASVRGVRAGALLGIVNEAGADIEHETAAGGNLSALIDTAIEAVRILIAMDSRLPT